jgi:hypothetical protein
MSDAFLSFPVNGDVSDGVLPSGDTTVVDCGGIESGGGVYGQRWMMEWSCGEKK